MTKELKPCPFCGSESVEYDYRAFKIQPWSVHCMWCHIRTDVYRTQEEALNVWNRRIER